MFKNLQLRSILFGYFSGAGAVYAAMEQWYTLIGLGVFVFALMLFIYIADKRQKEKIVYTEKEKHEFLIELVKKLYSSGDDYYAVLTNKTNWHFGYSNDYPLQHGKGQEFKLTDKMVTVLMKNQIK